MSTPIKRVAASPIHEPVPTFSAGTIRAMHISWWRAVFALVLALILLAGAWWTNADTAADAEAGLKRSLASFAMARGLAAAVSVVEGTEVTFQPLGVGVTLTPGHALRPLEEALEQFAQLMLAASIAFGAEMLLIKIGSHWVISALLSAAALSWAALVSLRGPVPPLLLRLLLVLVVVRFAVPAATAGSAFVYEHWMQPQYDAATRELSAHSAAVQGDARAIEEPEVTSDKGVLDKVKGMTAKIADVREVPKRLKVRGEQMMRHFVDISVVFLLQTLVLPLLFIWALIAVSRGVLSPLAWTKPAGGVTRER
jgi:hypothetical protein